MNPKIHHTDHLEQQNKPPMTYETDQKDVTIISALSKNN
jgi:hypothetical protein